MSFLDGLKQRKLVQWALAYLASAWIVMQLVDVLGGRWGVSDAQARIVDVILIVGLFVTLVFAWYHGEQGRQRISGPELLIIAGLLSVGAMLMSRIDLGQTNSAGGPITVATTPDAVVPLHATDEPPWIAVLPFKAQTDDTELNNFADGLTDDITSGLSSFSHLLILTRSAVQHAGIDVTDVVTIADDLDASYVMQGTLRRVGQIIRVSVNLVDGKNGRQVWAQSFDRKLADTDVLALQDEITDTIVATVADPYGVVSRTIAARIANRDPETLTPYEAVLRWFLYQQRISKQDHFDTRAALQRAVELQPDYADAWATLSNMYLQEFMQDFNQLPNARGRALEAAQQAVLVNPESHLANYSLAQAHYFNKNMGAFRDATERTISLNPRDTNSIAMLGILTGYGGDWEYGVELTTTAMKLNPNHPGWYRFNIFFDAYRQGKYSLALKIAQGINMPEYWADPFARLLAHAALGNSSQATDAADSLLQLWPEFEVAYSTVGFSNWIYAQPELKLQILHDLKKAGLDMLDENGK